MTQFKSLYIIPVIGRCLTRPIASLWHTLFRHMSNETENAWDWVPDALMLVWYFLLLPWFPFAALAGMVFDGGHEHWRYVFLTSIWLYPVSVVVTAKLRERYPLLILLPLATTLGGMLLAGAMEMVEG